MACHLRCNELYLNISGLGHVITLLMLKKQMLSFISMPQMYNIHKISHFRVLRQSKTLHKHHHLLKPALIFAPYQRIRDLMAPIPVMRCTNVAVWIYQRLWRNERLVHLRGYSFVGRRYRNAYSLLEDLGFFVEMTTRLPLGAQ